MLRVAASTGHKLAQPGLANPCMKTQCLVLGETTARGEVGRLLGQLQHLLGWHGERKGGSNTSQSPAWAVIAGMHMATTRMEDSSRLLDLAEGLMFQSIPCSLITILTTTNLLSLSAELLAHASLDPRELKRAGLAQAVETQALPASHSLLVNRSRRAGGGGMHLSARQVVISSADRPQV